MLQVDWPSHRWPNGYYLVFRCCYFVHFQCESYDCVQDQKSFHIPHICTFTGWTLLLWHLSVVAHQCQGFWPSEAEEALRFYGISPCVSSVVRFENVSANITLESMNQQGQCSLRIILFPFFLSMKVSWRLAFLPSVGLTSSSWSSWASKAKPLSLASRDKEKIEPILREKLSWPTWGPDTCLPRRIQS